MRAAVAVPLKVKSVSAAGVERGLLAIDSHTGNFVARGALLGAVVLLAIFITFDFNNNDSMRSGDLEGTRLSGDVVVLSLRIALKPVLVNPLLELPTSS